MKSVIVEYLYSVNQKVSMALVIVKRNSYSLNLWSTTGPMLFAVAKAAMKLKIALRAPRTGLMAALYRESDLRTKGVQSSPSKVESRRREVRRAYQWSKDSGTEPQKSVRYQNVS